MCTTAWARSLKKLLRIEAGCWNFGLTEACLSRNQVRQNMSIHEGEKVFEINSEDGPWVSKRQTGKSKIEKGIKRWRCGGGRVHAVDGLFQMGESAANCSGDRHVDVWWCI